MPGVATEPEAKPVLNVDQLKRLYHLRTKQLGKLKKVIENVEEVEKFEKEIISLRETISTGAA